MLIVLFVFAGILGLLCGGPRLPGSFVVELYLTRAIDESRSPSAVGFLTQEDLDLYRLTRGLREAASDRRVRGILVRISSIQTGWAAALEMRRALQIVRNSGIPLTVLMEAGGDKEYLVASAAESLFMLPGGHLMIDGLAAEVGFLHGMLKKVGLEVQVERVGEYKNAPDTYTRTTMSQCHREALDALIGDLFQTYVDLASSSRGIESDSLVVLLDRGPLSPREAMDAGLVDGLRYRREAVRHLGGSENVEVISLERYVAALKKEDGPHIAYIVVEGTMLPGGSGDLPLLDPIVGSETIARAFRDARADDDIEGVLLRINSPGGSAMAADVMWDEVRRTARDKPVVVSMGDMAASGGYYLAAAADRVIAEPTTITGSIGVYASKFVAEELYDDIDYHVEVVKRGAHADQFSMSRPFDGEERARLGNLMTQYYWDVFVAKVAMGRGMAAATVDSLGQGRVWSGFRAESCGLVDTLGGIWAARGQLAGLLDLPADSPMSLVPMPKPRSMLTRIFDMLLHGSTVEDELMANLSARTGLAPQTHVQMRLPFALSIE